ncbi:alpha/beta hydrolase [Aquabacter sp. L1I39]|uniref:alpha/beta hydrolase n=1 Tax=Aquabacter sp. L1I39 TaxID=2820278 RepID=UPI001ADBCC4E|nr:alpha/beta hydrolase [Aquabacter sp. L1I39]QTL04974.1 alpha/beta hydrolase [Aquabacter sp. L1I39]
MGRTLWAAALVLASATLASAQSNPPATAPGAKAGTAPAAAPAQPLKITGQCSQARLCDLKKYYEVPNFRIGGTYDLSSPAKWENGGEGGTTLESLGAGPLKTAYIALGTPRRNAAGEITNAVIVNTFYSGDSTDMYAQWVEGSALSGGSVIGPNRAIDTNQYYVVLLDGLGLWGASKPSDGLGQKFPQYGYMDLVQSNYRMLRDHLKIGRAALVTGVSMGATQTYVWGVMHPDFMNGLMPIGGTTQSDGEDPVGNWTFQLMSAAIESDPQWRATGGNYYNLPKDKHPNQGVAFGWSILLMTGFSFDFRSQQPWDKVQPDVFYWNPPNPKAGSSVNARALLFDAVDLLWRNRAGETYNINADLGRIKARTLVMHIDNDQWLTFDRAKRTVARVPGADFVHEPSPVAHYGVFSILKNKQFDPTVNGFLGDVARLTRNQALTATTYTTPSVAKDITPDKSFWNTYVKYPFPVKKTKVKDGQGVEWDIGYMDEYAGTSPNPDVLVIVHGKGAFGGHYGNIMRIALERGLRVIVPDLPHYGMSGPGNLDKSPARTMEDMRQVVHGLVVDQLGVKKAAYLGHSMGGQLVMGYALTYPDAVTKLILEAPAGLEEYPREVTVGPGKKLDLFNPAFARDFKAWAATWDQTGLRDREKNLTAQQVDDFFHFRTRDPVTGVVTPSKSGYFLRDSEYARLHTDQRIGMIKGDPRELQQWVDVFVFDIYTMASESLESDPKSLYKRLTEIKVPIFLAFGNKEPFIPSAPFNGRTDLSRQAILPFMTRMEAAGRDVQVKIYTDTAHFIHTDDPVEFAEDVVDFVKSGQVETTSQVIVDRLINGAPGQAAAAPAASPATAATPKGLNK